MGGTDWLELFRGEILHRSGCSGGQGGNKLWWLEKDLRVRRKDSHDTKATESALRICSSYFLGILRVESKVSPRIFSEVDQSYGMSHYEDLLERHRLELSHSYVEGLVIRILQIAGLAALL
jgi:hypothetical protein